jgi:hypothetical protein
MPEVGAGNAFLGVVGLVNVGLVVYLVKVVIAPLAMNIKTLNAGVEELFLSRNCHETKIVAIETTHRIRGCDTPFNQGAKK